MTKKPKSLISPVIVIRKGQKLHLVLCNPLAVMSSIMAEIAAENVPNSNTYSKEA